MSTYDSPEYAAAFQEYRGQPLRILERYVSRLRPMISDVASPLGIDAGAGTGHFAIPFLGSLLSSGALVAIDRSMEMLRILHSRSEGQQNLFIVQGSLDRLPFAFSRVDLFWISDVLHALESVENSIRAVFHLMKKGGVLAIRTSTRSDLQSYEWGQFFPEALALDLARHFSESELESVLWRCGFQNVDLIKVDETRSVGAAQYTSFFDRKYISSLTMIDAALHTQGMNRLRLSIEKRPIVVRNARTTLLTARKP